MAEDSDTGLLREIDEELRQEHYAHLWSRYGKGIIAAAVILVATVAGYKGWQSYDLSQRTDFGRQFALAESSATIGDLEAAQTQFSKLAAEGTDGYQVLANFRAAALLSQAGDLSTAAEMFRSISTDSGTPTEYRDLALILAAMNGIDAGEDPSGIANALLSISTGDNPWRHSAREVAALAMIEMGNLEEAKSTLIQLSSDATAPSGVRNRAQELLSALNTR